MQKKGQVRGTPSLQGFCGERERETYIYIYIYICIYPHLPIYPHILSTSGGTFNTNAERGDDSLKLMRKFWNPGFLAVEFSPRSTMVPIKRTYLNPDARLGRVQHPLI